MSSIESIINRQLLKWELERKKAAEEENKHPVAPPQIVTISRQTGSRGSYFASRLAERLDYQRLHREVIDAICESSGYQKRIIETLDEHFRNDLELNVEAMLRDRSVDHQDYFRHLFRVVLSMSRLGGVILLGRGGNFILGPQRGFHIRVVAPREKRIENLIKYCNILEKDAGDIVDQSDDERRQFIARLFHTDIDDPRHYDMIVNSSYIDIEEMVETVAMAVAAKYNKLEHLDHDTI